MNAEQASNKAAIDDLTKGWQLVDVVAALDEIEREINVRSRCFLRWIEDGRLSRTDAKDRLQRLIKAGQLCQMGIDSMKKPAIDTTAGRQCDAQTPGNVLREGSKAWKEQSATAQSPLKQ